MNRNSFNHWRHITSRASSGEEAKKPRKSGYKWTHFHCPLQWARHNDTRAQSDVRGRDQPKKRGSTAGSWSNVIYIKMGNLYPRVHTRERRTHATIKREPTWWKSIKNLCSNATKSNITDNVRPIKQHLPLNHSRSGQDCVVRHAGNYILSPRLVV